MRSREDPKIRGTGNKCEGDMKMEAAIVTMTRRWRWRQRPDEDGGSHGDDKGWMVRARAR